MNFPFLFAVLATCVFSIPTPETTSSRHATFTVPSDNNLQQRSVVDPSDCSNVCGTVSTQQASCLRWDTDCGGDRSIPAWNNGAAPWLSYDCLVCKNIPGMLKSFWSNDGDIAGFVGDDSIQEVQDIINAVWHVAQSASFPAMLAFAVLMQESSGSVRPPNGDQGNARGLFQVQHKDPTTQVPDGATCNHVSYQDILSKQVKNPDGSPKNVVGDCPLANITKMAQQGICGWDHSTGDSDCNNLQEPGLAYYWKKYNQDAGKMARNYNTGVIPSSSDLTYTFEKDGTGQGRWVGEPSYSSDIANRAFGRLSNGMFTFTCCADNTGNAGDCGCQDPNNKKPILCAGQNLPRPSTCPAS